MKVTIKDSKILKLARAVAKETGESINRTVLSPCGSLCIVSALKDQTRRPLSFSALGVAAPNFSKALQSITIDCFTTKWACHGNRFALHEHLSLAPASLPQIALVDW